MCMQLTSTSTEEKSKVTDLNEWKTQRPSATGAPEKESTEYARKQRIRKREAEERARSNAAVLRNHNLGSSKK